MLELRNVWKSFEQRHGRKDVLRGINVRLRRGDHLGILGRNGAGKSTLVRVLAGVEAPTRGSIRREMLMSWPLGGGYGIQSSLTGRNNARFIARLYGMSLSQTEVFVEDFSELGRYFDEPVKYYSSGMRSRLMMALSFAVDFDGYLVDEALSTGDARFANKCLTMFEERRKNAAVIMISHNLNHVRRYCRTAAVLRNGILEFYEDVDEAIAAYQGL
ncbi:ABC transporter ATP-binding protein [Teichococcus oryzae]|uniref:ABC transporter ATP-binding protein n=1 Tax=Teichococcus oryzae TaxID=1608942 RepID=A0A5B2TIP7_9PROT|nr:ABC transporter ATP-binding protein [Pseudoroseomonas oryzae]KAA2213660.1 ABC transporter ATP-binding protein [Pseudoroseomonas oryzae]